MAVASELEIKLVFVAATGKYEVVRLESKQIQDRCKPRKKRQVVSFDINSAGLLAVSFDTKEIAVWRFDVEKRDFKLLMLLVTRFSL